MSESKTPRTDALARDWSEREIFEHARKLELELADANHRIEAVKASNVLNTTIDEIIRLREENTKLQDDNHFLREISRRNECVESATEDEAPDRFGGLKGMKRMLVNKQGVIWHFVDGNRIEGCHDKISGYVTGLSGDVSDCDISVEDREVGVDIADLIAL